MLDRVLEPEVMDSFAEASDYNEMDHSAVNNIFVNDLMIAGFAGGDVLDLGTGTALIPIEIISCVENCRIMAVDMSRNMLEIARYNLEARGATLKVQLGLIDAKTLPYPSEMFDAVISNSIIHHLADPIACLREALRVAKPGALLFFRDLLRPNDRGQLERLVQSYCGLEKVHAQQMFRESLHAALSLNEIEDLIQMSGFDRTTVRQSSDRHWTWTAHKPKPIAA